MFLFVNPIYWLRKTVQPNSNTKTIVTLYLQVSWWVNLAHYRFNPNESSSWWTR